MTAASLPATSTATAASPSGLRARLRRIGAIARAETLLLVRNKTVLATGLGLGPVTALFMVWVMPKGDDNSMLTVAIATTMLSWCTLMAVYYNLTSVFVARREERVLARMSTGEATGWEAVIAASVPAVVIMVIQVVGATLVMGVVSGFPALTSPLLALLAILGTAIVFVALAAVTAGFTRTVEAAQYSTLPIMLLAIALSGTIYPTANMPEALRYATEFSPLYAASDLVNIGLGGMSLSGEAAGSWFESIGLGAQSLLVLAAWCVACIVAAQRTMRFSPRR